MGDSNGANTGKKDESTKKRGSSINGHNLEEKKEEYEVELVNLLDHYDEETVLLENESQIRERGFGTCGTAELDHLSFVVEKTESSEMAKKAVRIYGMIALSLLKEYWGGKKKEETESFLNFYYLTKDEILFKLKRIKETGRNKEVRSLVATELEYIYSSLQKEK